MAHSRLVTNGSQLDSRNNQPCISEDLICVHNGIVTNEEQIKKENEIVTETELDTEVLTKYVSQCLRQNVKNIGQTLKEEIEGNYSSCFIDLYSNNFYLTSNNRSLYILCANGFSVIHILKIKEFLYI